MGKSVGTVDHMDLSSFGTYAGELAIPKTGAVGWYQFSLKADFGGSLALDYEKAGLVCRLQTAVEKLAPPPPA